MQNMRDLLRSALGRSLEALPPLDRLVSAWPVVCGPAMAQRGCVVAYEDAVLTVEVENGVWMEQMLGMRDVLQHELARVAGVPLRAIHFKPARPRQTGRHRHPQP